MDDPSNVPFENFVAEAIDSIPDQYQEKMKSVAILVADEPTNEQRRKLSLRSGVHLFGLYEGIPLPLRGGALLAHPPDIITIFKHPMMEMFPNTRALKKQVAETLWHEVAHYFGLDHDQINKAKHGGNKSHDT